MIDLNMLRALVNIVEYIYESWLSFHGPSWYLP